MLKRVLACLLVLAALAPASVEAWGYLDFTNAANTGVTYLPVSDWNTPRQGNALTGSRGVTVSLWIRYTSTPSRHYILSDFGGGSIDLRHDNAFGTIYWAVIGAGAMQTSDAIPPLNTWWNLTCTYDKNRTVMSRCFFNGVRVNITAGATVSVDLATTVGNMVTSQTIDQFMPGHVSNLKIWGRGLADEEVPGEMVCANPVNPQDLIAWFPFNGHIKVANGVPFHNSTTGGGTAVVRFHTEDGPPIQLCGGG